MAKCSSIKARLYHYVVVKAVLKLCQIKATEAHARDSGNCSHSVRKFDKGAIQHLTMAVRHTHIIETVIAMAYGSGSLLYMHVVPRTAMRISVLKDSKKPH